MVEGSGLENRRGETHRGFESLLLRQTSDETERAETTRRFRAHGSIERAPRGPVTIRSWRDGRAAEGAPLLREYGVYSSIEGSNPSLSANVHGRGFQPAGVASDVSLGSFDRRGGRRC